MAPKHVIRLEIRVTERLCDQRGKERGQRRLVHMSFSNCSALQSLEDLWRFDYGSGVLLLSGVPIVFPCSLCADRWLLSTLSAGIWTLVYPLKIADRSPSIVSDRIEFLLPVGRTVVVPAAPRFEVLARNALPKEAGVYNASPTPSAGQILVRVGDQLFCLGGG